MNITLVSLLKKFEDVYVDVDTELLIYFKVSLSWSNNS